MKFLFPLALALTFSTASQADYCSENFVQDETPGTKCRANSLQTNVLRLSLRQMDAINELENHGRVFLRSLEVKASPNAEKYSNVTEYTYVAYKQTGWTSHVETAKLVITSMRDTRLYDAVLYNEESKLEVYATPSAPVASNYPICENYVLSTGDISAVCAPDFAVTDLLKTVLRHKATLSNLAENHSMVHFNTLEVFASVDLDIFSNTKTYSFEARDIIGIGVSKLAATLVIESKRDNRVQDAILYVDSEKLTIVK